MTRRICLLYVTWLALAQFGSGNIGLCLAQLGCSMNGMSRGVYSVIRISHSDEYLPSVELQAS